MRVAPLIKTNFNNKSGSNYKPSFKANYEVLIARMDVNTFLNKINKLIAERAVPQSFKFMGKSYKNETVIGQIDGHTYAQMRRIGIFTGHDYFLTSKFEGDLGEKALTAKEEQIDKPLLDIIRETLRHLNYKDPEKGIRPV